MKYFAAALALLASLAAPAYFAAAQQGTADSEQAIFLAANRERSARGLKALKWDEELAKAARQHARQMAAQNAISHQFSGEPDPAARARASGAHFSAMAENVALGPSADTIHMQWMKSPPHRANLLDPGLNALGVGVAERNGDLFAVQDFSTTLAQLSLEEQEERVGAQLRARGLHVAAEKAERTDARRNCDPEHNLGIRDGSGYAMRYSTGDLDNLPHSLEQQIKTGKYKSVAVGACLTAGAAYSQYYIGVLLYE